MHCYDTETVMCYCCYRKLITPSEQSEFPPFHSHQSKAGCQIFDLLVDEAAELQLALCTFGGFLVLGLCALHSVHGRVKEPRTHKYSVYINLVTVHGNQRCGS